MATCREPNGCAPPANPSHGGGAHPQATVVPCTSATTWRYQPSSPLTGGGALIAASGEYLTAQGCFDSPGEAMIMYAGGEHRRLQTRHVMSLAGCVLTPMALCCSQGLMPPDRRQADQPGLLHAGRWRRDRHRPEPRQLLRGGGRRQGNPHECPESAPIGLVVSSGGEVNALAALLAVSYLAIQVALW